jgi:hypothetical protein
MTIKMRVEDNDSLHNNINKGCFAPQIDVKTIYNGGT